MSQSITPPLELLKQWEDDWFEEREHADVLLIQAFQAGADQELGACCEVLNEHNPSAYWGELLRSRRRPKPPSLKEQALEQLDGIAAVFRMTHGGNLVCDTIRRALEQLDD